MQFHFLVVLVVRRKSVLVQKCVESQITRALPSLKIKYSRRCEEGSGKKRGVVQNLVYRANMICKKKKRIVILKWIK